QELGLVLVPPYNDEKIIAGQGTIGLEILEDLPGVDLVLIPIGGGGGVSGGGTGGKKVKPQGKSGGGGTGVAADAHANPPPGKKQTRPPAAEGATAERRPAA